MYLETKAVILVLQLLDELCELGYLLLQLLVHREEGLLAVQLLVGSWALHPHALADSWLSRAVDVVGSARHGARGDGQQLSVLAGC